MIEQLAIAVLIVSLIVALISLFIVSLVLVVVFQDWLRNR